MRRTTSTFQNLTFRLVDQVYYIKRGAEVVWKVIVDNQIVGSEFPSADAAIKLIPAERRNNVRRPIIY